MRQYLASMIVMVALSGVVAAGDMTTQALIDACGKLAAKGEGLTVVGRHGWLFNRNELRHLGVGGFWGQAAAEVSRCTSAGKTDPLAAIIHYHEQLKAVGIHLIFLPVPPKAVIYPEQLPGMPEVTTDPVPRLDAYHQAFYALLCERGVDVLDMTDTFLKERYAAEGLAYCMQDSHWSARACELTAKALAARIKAQAWYADAAKRKFATESRTVVVDGDLRGRLTGAKPAPERLPLRRVGIAAAGALTAVKPDPASPVVLMGDSHCLVFSLGEELLATHAGLPDQLAAELGLPVDLVGVRGSGARSARIQLYRRARKSGYLDAKKVVIWCLSARAFTEASSGWGRVPIKR